MGLGAMSPRAPLAQEVTPCHRQHRQPLLRSPTSSSTDRERLALAGPIFLGANAQRMDRHGAGRLVHRGARRAGIDKHIGPHALRHAFITAALDAGVPLRDVHEAASHDDPHTTMRYDRARVSLDRHATYIAATYIAGASRYQMCVVLGAGYPRSAPRAARQLVHELSADYAITKS